jgi:diguanylate cyclase (GGDEF)-like protein
MIERFSNPLVPFMNETFRLIVFFFMSYLVSELKEANEKQKKLARTDPLTGLLNRLAFFEYMDIEWNKAKRFGYHVSVIYIDVDDFKIANDIFGHYAGDKILCSIANIIKSNIRVIDIAARFGGDEFAILLPQTSGVDSCRVASKIQKKLLISTLKGQWQPSLSIGIATYERMPEDIKEMIHKADTLMYAAKQDGKNTIRHQVLRDDKAA